MASKSKTDKALDLIINSVSETRSDMSQVKNDMSEVKVKLADYNGILDQHTRRSTLLEENLELVKSEHNARIDALAKEVKPLTIHVAKWAGVGKALAILSALAVIIGTVLAWIQLYRG